MIDSTPPPHQGAYIPGTTPTAVTWFRVYLAIFCFIYLLCAVAGGLLCAEVFPVTAEDMDGVPPQVMGAIYLVIGLFFLIVFALPFFLPRRPWVWIYNLVLICIGMTSCTIVASIPLLIFWLKPNVKGYYGKTQP